MKKQIIILSLLASALGYAQEEKKDQTSETKNIKEVTIKKTKKAIEQKADRTIFDFSEQEHLNTGTAMEGIKKLPGLMSSDLTGMSYQGKNLAVYMDGRPLNINSTELSAFLDGLPGNAIDRIEIITNPGAEYPATGGGAILNIITSRTAKNYLTATYSGNYSFSNYDKLRHRTNQSILLNAKNQWFGWQLNTGVNYNENMNDSKMGDFSQAISDNRARGYFLRSALNFHLGKDRLLLNYNLNHNNNDGQVDGSGKINHLAFERYDAVQNKNLRHEAMATYQKRFDDPSKKLDFKLSYSHFDRNFEQENQLFRLNSVESKQPLYHTNSNSKTAEFRINYSQDIPLLDKGKIHIGGLYERLHLITNGLNIKNLDYKRQTIASFAELQTSKGKFDFTLGVRGEDYDIGGITYNAKNQKYEDLKPFKQYRFFPNASVQYNFSPMMNMALNYNKKIWLPRVNQLNPNAGEYANDTFANVGNANLQPTIYDDFEAKFTAFNYLSVSYTLGLEENDMVDRFIRDGDKVLMINTNIPSIKRHTFSVGVPFPLAIFKHSFKEMMSMHPDKLNLIYFVLAYQKRDIPDFKTNGFLYLNANGNLSLPQGIKFNFNYTIMPKNGDYYYYKLLEPLGHTLNLTLSKKFLKNQLNVSLFANDVFDTSRGLIETGGIQPPVIVSFKSNSRSFGISLNYKIPTRNKLAKEDPNLLLREQKEESGLIK